jgi:hypothetical protein
LFSTKSFDTRTNLHEFFEKSKKNYEKIVKSFGGDGSLEESHRLFMVSFLRLLYIFYTKISFEKVREVVKDVIEFLQGYISNLRLTGNKGNNFLNWIVLMALFSLHYTIEGNNQSLIFLIFILLITKIKVSIQNKKNVYKRR